MGAQYTANLAKALVTTAQRGEVDSFEDALAGGLRVCVVEPLVDQLTALYPGLRGLYVASGDGSDPLDRMDRGECDLALVSEVTWENAVRGVYSPEDPRRHCGKVASAGAVYIVGNAVPFGDEVAGTLKLLVSQQQEEGWHEVDRKRVLAARWPARQCPAFEGLVTAATDGALSVTDMAGLFILLALVLVFALAAALAGRLRERLKAKEDSSYVSMRQLMAKEQINAKAKEMRQVVNASSQRHLSVPSARPGGMRRSSAHATGVGSEASGSRGAPGSMLPAPGGSAADDGGPQGPARGSGIGIRRVVPTGFVRDDHGGRLDSATRSTTARVPSMGIPDDSGTGAVRRAPPPAPSFSKGPDGGPAATASSAGPRARAWDPVSSTTRGPKGAD